MPQDTLHILLGTLGLALAAAGGGRALLHATTGAAGGGTLQAAWFGLFYGAAAWLALAPVAIGIPPSTSAGFWASAALAVALAWWILRAFERLFGSMKSVLAERLPLGLVVAAVCASPVLVPVYWTWHFGATAYQGTTAVEPAALEACPPAARIVHASDSHVALAERTRDGEVSGRPFVKPLLDQARRLRAGLVLLSGDLTDHGEEAEWRIVADIAGAARGTTLIVAPGNHDISPAYRREAEGDRLNRLDHATQARWLRYLAAAARLAPDLRAADGRTLREVHDALARHLPAFPALKQRHDAQCDAKCAALAAAALARQGPLKPDAGIQLNQGACEQSCRDSLTEPAYLWDRGLREFVANGFPLAYSDAAGRLAVLVLNSVQDDAELIGRSGIGGIDDAQLARLKAAIDKAAAQADSIVILMHHAPFRTTQDRFTGPENPFAVRDWKDSEWWSYALLRFEAPRAAKLADALREAARGHPKVDFIVAYGHRHRTAPARLADPQGSRGVRALEAGKLADRRFYTLRGKSGALSAGGCSL